MMESGYGELSIEGIAARAGAGKQTVYRWWPAKSFIVADAVAEGYLQMPATTIVETSSVEEDLLSWAGATTRALEDPRASSIIRALVSAASDDSAEVTNLYAQLTGPNHEALVARLRHGQDAGQLSADVDAQAIADALVGTVLFGIMAHLPTQNRVTAVIRALFRSEPA